MKATGCQQALPVGDPKSLVDIEVQVPRPESRDLLVRIEAVSVNPVDYKIRNKTKCDPGDYKILGWDAAGVVEQTGNQVEMFKPGDRVWYAGAIDRPGCNSEYHVVDERLVAKMPSTLSYVQAAAMPLTSITAWEILFERFRLNKESQGSLLVVGAAGGVGSMMIQLAKALTSMTVIATASRAETRDWVKRLGADHVVNHHALQSELVSQGFTEINLVAGLNQTKQHWPTITAMLAPQGQFCLIDDPGSLDIMPLKSKSVSVHWEFMFTRSLFKTADMIEQHRLLTHVANMVDKGVIHTTLNNDFGTINARNLIKAHALLESGKSVGKIALSGF